MINDLPDTGYSEDRRENPRVWAVLRCDYKFGDVIRRGVTRDLSESGLFIHAAQPPPPGTRIFLRLRLPRATDAIKIAGYVRRVVEGEGDKKPGMGIEFATVYAAHQADLTGFVRNSLGLPVDDKDVVSVPGTTEYKYTFVGNNAWKPDPTPAALAERSSRKAAPRPPPPPDRSARPPRAASDEHSFGPTPGDCTDPGHAELPLSDSLALAELESLRSRLVQARLSWVGAAALLVLLVVWGVMSLQPGAIDPTPYRAVFDAVELHEPGGDVLQLRLADEVWAGIEPVRRKGALLAALAIAEKDGFDSVQLVDRNGQQLGIAGPQGVHLSELAHRQIPDEE